MSNRKKIIGEKEMNEIIFKKAEKDLHEYLDDLIHTAKWIVRDLESYKLNLNQAQAGKSKSEFTTQEVVIQWAMNRVQQVNWHFDEGARFVGKYMEAKISNEFYKKAKGGE
ncbi:unnamed protein product [marine sediment metagenome]|uniref:Uncharacterized protein n=1 Tax=marine sediment metagenome TaxID=412755 RepID=X1UEY3_9ZZZZ